MRRDVLLVESDRLEKSTTAVVKKPDFSTFNFRPERRHSVAKRRLILQTSLSSTREMRGAWRSCNHASHHPALFSMFSSSLWFRLVRIHCEHVRLALSKSRGVSMEKISSRISAGAIFAAGGDDLLVELHFESCRPCDMYLFVDLFEIEGIDLVDLRLVCVMEAFVDI